ncbi:MAG: hypothetical protein AAFV93_19660, partial [Chloroflexota bacterium]
MTARSMPPTSPRFRLNPWLVRIPLLLVTGIILTIIVLVLFLAAFQLRVTDRIVPGTYALGIDLSGMTTEEAEIALSQAFSYGDDAVFTFRDGENFWQLTASDLGVS